MRLTAAVRRRLALEFSKPWLTRLQRVLERTIALDDEVSEIPGCGGAGLVVTPVFGILLFEGQGDRTRAIRQEE